MKKIMFLIILLFLPVIIKADYKVDNYRIDMTVLNNGDVHIVEAFQMSGTYNGYERKINYKGNYRGYKGANLASTNNYSLYDGNRITLEEVRAINFDYEKTVLELQASGDLFNRVNSAVKGDYGVYKVQRTTNGEIYTIYNASKMNKDIYLEYTLENMAILHNDVSELALTLFSDLNEDIEALEIYIHIPNNDSVVRFWLHDNIENTAEIIDYETVKVNINSFNKEKELDFRLLFNKDVLLNARKTTEENVWETVLEIEEKLENQPLEYKDEEYERVREIAYDLVSNVERTKNQSDYDQALVGIKSLREEDELQVELLVRLLNVKPLIERNEVFLKVILTSIMGVWVLGLLVIFYQIYKKYNHNYETKFSDKYTKEIPNNYPPFVTGYLIKKQIENTDLAATILDLEKRKIINIKKDKEDYIIKKENINNLELEEERIIKLLFQGNEKISLSELNIQAQEQYSLFLSSYSNWLNSAMGRVEKENLFEHVSFIKLIGIIYAIIGVIIGLVLIGKDTYFPSINIITISLIVLLFFMFFYKKTAKGKEDYCKWRALKRYLDEFNEEKLPKFEIFQEYLIYSISLGSFDKFIKRIKSEFSDTKEYVKYEKIINKANTIIYFSSHIVHVAYKTKNNINDI